MESKSWRPEIFHSWFEALKITVNLRISSINCCISDATIGGTECITCSGDGPLKSRGPPPPFDHIFRRKTQCLLKEEIPQMREIAYHSIGKENGVMKAFRIERMIFPEKENMVIKNGLVAVSEEKILCEDCRMILNPDIF